MDPQKLRKRLGQRLSVGFDGPTIPDEYRQMIREYKIGNVILFRRNVHSCEQLKKLCEDLRVLILEETGMEPFIMIDEEGGSVSRLAEIGVPTPSCMAIGATGDPENARRIARSIGDDLHAIGVNFNLAPVLDCFTNPENTADGNRCFAADPNVVGRFGSAYIQGLKETGVMGCGKHFPGHGDTAVDSHLAKPTINKTMKAMWENELIPFSEAIKAGVDAIMSAHIVFPALDPKDPATVSKPVLTGLLREEMGFDGLIISDGMEMRAVLDLYGIQEGTLRALNAGVDVALICHSAQEAIKTMQHLEQAYAEGKLTEENIIEHYQRIANSKSCYRIKDGIDHPFATPEQINLARKIMDQSITLLHAPDGAPLPTLSPETVVISTKARRNSLVNDDIKFNPAACFAEVFGCRYAQAMPDELPETLVALIGRHPEAYKTIEAVAKAAEKGTKVIAVSLFTPFVLRGIPDTAWKIGAWQYDELAVRAVADYLKQQRA